MISLFKPASTSYIGVDISGSHVKMMELTGTRTKIRVERYHVESVPEGAYTDSLVTDPEKLGEALRKCWQYLGTKTRTLALAMPSAHVTTKKIEVPSGIPEREVFDLVEAEVANFVPVARVDINVDFQIVGPAKKEGYDEVFIAVTKRHNVEQLLLATHHADLTARILDIESNPIMHSLNEMLPDLENNGEDANIMVADLGSDHSNFLVYKNRELLYSMEVNTVGLGLRQTIQNTYGLPPVQATQMMINPEPFLEQHPNYVADILQPFLDSQAMEITRQIQAFERAGNPGGIKHIVLAGGIAALVGLEDAVRERTGIDTLIANPMAACSLAPKIDPNNLLNEAPRLMVCFGLALRSFV